MNNKLSGLYGITDPQLLPDTDTLLSSVELALQGGMSILQYRAKSVPGREQITQAGQLKKLCQHYQAIFIINDNVELAGKVQADGIHLGRDDVSITAARERLGEKTIIGCSCYNRLDLALYAQQQGTDYVAFGRFYPSRNKPGAVQAPLQLLQQARSVLDVPVCAIGGITTHNAGILIKRGADMVAVIDDLFSASDVYQQAKDFLINIT